MSANTLILSIIAFVFGKPSIKTDKLLKSILLGLIYALALYLVFWVGNKLLVIFSNLFPQILSNRMGHLDSIYGNRGNLSPWIISALLFFPIGFGEEFFWRGFIQKELSGKFSPFYGFVLTTLIYTAVHVPTLNPILILAAFVCGLFWGALYWKTKSLFPIILSHMLWDPLIFVLLPIY